MTEQKEPQTYEVGYHIVSTVSEDALPKEVAKLTDIVKALGGTFVAEGFPVKTELAYMISKKFGTERHDFTSTYFGWVAFELSPDKINECKIQIEALQNVLRFIIIKTTKEDVASALQAPKVEEEHTRLVADESKAGEVSEKALDEVLEGIGA